MYTNIVTAAHKCDYFLKKRSNGFLTTKYVYLVINLSQWDHSPVGMEDKSWEPAS